MDFFFLQKLFINAKETDEITNKKEERTFLESEVRKMNEFSMLHQPNPISLLTSDHRLSSIGQGLIASK